MIGMGTGLCTAGFARFVDDAACPGRAEARYEVTPLVGVTLGIVCMVSVFWLIPLSNVQEFDPANPMSEMVHTRSARSNRAHQMIVICCLAFSTLRGFIMSGVEVATAMLLEVDYKWSLEWISIAIGFCFSACIPVQLAYHRFGANLSVKSWIRSMLALAALGCLLYFRLPHWILAAVDPKFQTLVQGAVLLLADALVSPSFLLSDALSQGVMKQHWFPIQGSFLDERTLNLLQCL